jgi:hypothetical protein
MFLMSLSGTVEKMARPFDATQGMLQAKRMSVMPVLRLRSGETPADSQCGGRGQRHKTWIPLSRERWKGEVDFQPTLSESVGFDPRGVGSISEGNFVEEFR